MSSNTNIGNTPVNQGYVQLIHMGETGGIDGTLRALYDGDGTASDLLIASDKVKISTTLYIGTDTLAEYIQDTVGVMFSSNTETNITVTYQDADGTIDLVSTGEVTLVGSQTLTNKTLTSPVINTGISGSAILDEDNMASNSATKLSTQQSIKAYVDAEVAGVVDTAPAALNTLNELAAALGDDANYATTTATALGTKLVKSSNLSDLTNATTARSNLGLGTSAVLNTAAVANSATTLSTGDQIYDFVIGLGYTTNTGDITSVVAGTGLSGGATSDVATLNVDASQTQITAVGTIGTGVWNGTAIASAYLDSDTAHLSGTQTFSGAKTFTGRLTISDAGADGLHLNQDTGATTNSNRLFFTGSATSAIFQSGTALSFRSGATAGASSGTQQMYINSSGITMFNTINLNSNALTGVSSITLGGHSFDDIDIGSEFVDADDHIMSAGAIKEKIENYGYTTSVGDITGVDLTGGTGIAIGSETNTTSGAYSSTISLSHLGLEDLADPNDDRILFWDDSVGDVEWLDIGSNISISGSSISATNTTYASDDFDHDALINFVANEHIDWTGASAGTIHASNYTDTVTTIDGTTANGVLTYGGTNNIDTEQYLTYGSSVLEVREQVKVTDGTRDIRLNSNHGSKAVVGTVGSHDFNFITANTIRATVDSGGNFGIGTETPTQDLTIFEDSGDCNVLISSANGASQVFFGDDEDDNIGIIRYDHGSNFMKFTTNTGAAMTIDSSQRVGIGETSPTALLQISHTGSGGTGTLKLQDNARRMYLGRDTIKVTDLSDTTHQLYIASNTTFNGNAVVTGVLTVDDAGDANEGGEIALNPGTSHSAIWKIDSFYGHLRMFSSTTTGEQFRFTNDGNLAQLTGTKHYFDGVGHTYISETSNDNLGFYVGNVQMLMISTSGTDVVYTPDDKHLGVGDDADLNMIHTSGASYMKNNTGMLTFQQLAQDQDIRFQVNDGGVTSSILTLNSASSRVGIGTTSPGALFTVYKDGTQAASVSTTYQMQTVSNSNGGIAIQAGASSKGYLVFGDTGDYDAGRISYDNATHRMGLWTNNAQVVGIDSTGLGIGIANPVEKLHIVSASGDARILLDAPNGSDTEVKFFNAGAAVWTLGHDDGSGAFRLGTTNVDSGVAINVATGGNVGIGEVAPASKIQVQYTTTSNGSAAIAEFGESGTGAIANSGHQVIIGGPSVGGYTGALIYSDSTSGYGQISFADGRGANDSWRGVIVYKHSDEYMGFWTNASEKMRIVSGGDVHCDQDVIAYSSTPSDIRLKENFTKIDNGLDIINKLDGHTFNWKKDGDRLSAGFKAQEVEKILPHLVDEKKLPLHSDDDKEYKILRYEEIIPYLVEAIKEQQEQIDELRKGNFVIETGD